MVERRTREKLVHVLGCGVKSGRITNAFNHSYHTGVLKTFAYIIICHRRLKCSRNITNSCMKMEK
jgi:hypothetical protein